MSRVITFIFLTILIVALSGQGCTPRKPAESGSREVTSPDATRIGSPSRPGSSGYEPVRSSKEEKPEKTMLKNLEGSRFGIKFYPGSKMVEAFTARLPIGPGGWTGTTAIFTTGDDVLEIKDFFTGQFDSPTISEDENGVVTVTRRIRDLWESEDVLMIMIEPNGREGYTKIVIFSLK